MTFWAGLRDFDEQAHRLGFFVEMTHNSKIVAHSKRTQGSISCKHYQRVEAQLYHPHDRKSSPNARPLMAPDWIRDGDCTITVTRQTDGQVIRRFAYTARDGAIQHRPETRFGYQPAIDYRPPRVRDKSITGYDFIEAIWIGPAD